MKESRLHDSLVKDHALCILGLNVSSSTHNCECVVHGGNAIYSNDWSIINPRRACAARVTVLGLSFCLSVCPPRYSGSTRK